MRLIFVFLIILAAAAQAQQSLSSPVTIGGINCGELRLAKQFPAAGQYLAWRNCEAGGKMAMELFNSSNVRKMRVESSTSSSLTLYDASNFASVILGDGEIWADSGSVARIRISAINQRMDVLSNTGSSVLARMAANGDGGLFTSAGKEAALSVTGDALGSMSLLLRNRAAENGAILFNPSLDLADMMFRGSSNTQRSIRLENRLGFVYCDTQPEFQFGDMASYPGGIGLMVNTKGACVNRGDYIRWLGATSGYAGLAAPDNVTSYTLLLPPTISGHVGKCLYLAVSNELNFTPCGGTSGTQALPIDFQSSGINKFRFYDVVGYSVLDVMNPSNIAAIRLSTFLGGSGIQLKDQNGAGDAGLFTGGNKGASLELYQKDRSWLGAKLEAGAWSDDSGALTLYRHNSPDLTNQIAVSLKGVSIQWYSGGVTMTDLGFTSGISGYLRLRRANGNTLALINDFGYSFDGNTGITATIDIMCSNGSPGTLSVNGGVVSGTSCP